MSLLNQLFNRGVLGAKCKTCLNLAIARIKLLQNKRDVQLKLMRKEIAQFLQAGQEAIARIRVEHVIREQNIWAAYEILELFCEFILARVPILENQRTCPPEMREAIASIIFAAPRCSDLPDLLTLRNLFAAKYGKEFVAAASELRPDTSVNRTIVEKLSVYAPSGESKLNLLKEIAREFNLEWDSSQTEAEFSKKPEDLLNGPKPVSSSTLPQSETKAHSNGSSSQTSQAREQIQSPIPTNSITFCGENSTNAEPPKPRPSDVLERAQAAIAAAGRAIAMARAAAELANVKFMVPNVGEMKC
ncbi:IST1 homolog [Impatiens glandulifera]|uniref:IST1 homolog n=1 Tax=Impatiens glandulifera TaxID=253017 RepID=UPI001FB197CD|nr:IST1 homolog [Impatiens glandulifera]